MSAQQPILELTSHVQGKNAQVFVFPDRLEWVQKGSAAARWTAATVTLGASLLAGKKEAREVIPVRMITNVSAKRDGLRNSAVTVTSAGGSVDFRVSHSEAQQLQSTLLHLMMA